MAALQGQARQDFLRKFWEEHPALYEVAQIVSEGQWVSHIFEWVFMMVARFAGYLMTLAIGYLIYYAIETKHSIDTIPAHPQFVDQVAIYSNVIINVTPELVFPGVVVMCLWALSARRWADSGLYAVVSIFFAWLTIALLNAFMHNQITESFLAGMLLWRAIAALVYTVVVAYCGSHGGLDLRTLLKELDTLREEIRNRDQSIEHLQRKYDAANQRITALARQVQDKEQEVSQLKDQVNNKQSLLTNGQGALSDLEGQLQEVSLQLQQANREKQQLSLQLQEMTSQVSGANDLFTKLQNARKQVSDLTGQLQEMTCEKQEVTSQMNRSQQQVSDLEKQVSDLTGQVTLLTSQLQEVTSPTGQMKAVKSKKSPAEEVTQKSQGTVLQFDEGRRRRNPLEVKAWCDAHPDLTQAEQAEQLGISDAANLRRILRRVREQETGQIDQQVANDL